MKTADDTSLFHVTVQSLIVYLRRHPEILLNIGYRHYPDRQGLCAAHHNTRWPCFLRCVAEEALRVPPNAIGRPHE